MKSVKTIIFFLAIAAIFLSFWINVIFVNSLNSVDTQIIDRLGKIYISSGDIPTTNDRDTLTKILESNNAGVFKNLLGQNDPVANFYGFCGFMKSNQKEAIKNLNIILSDRDCTIVYNGTEIKSYLGYAVLLLLYNNPEWLMNTPTDNFEKGAKKNILKLFKSEKIASLNYFDFYSIATRLIVEKYQDKELTDSIIAEIVNNAETNGSLTEQEEMLVADLLPHFPKKKQVFFVQLLLESKNEAIQLKVLQIIGSDTNSDITTLLENIIDTTDNEDILLLSMDKYGKLLKKESLPMMEQLIKRNTTKIVVKCLDIIGIYGTTGYYEFFKKYMSNIYSADVNIAAFNAIAETHSKTAKDRETVHYTAALAIRNSNKPDFARWVISYHIRKNITENHGLILLRLRQRETDEMKNLALDYISHFKLTSGIGLLQLLETDENDKVRKRAQKIMNELSS